MLSCYFIFSSGFFSLENDAFSIFTFSIFVLADVPIIQYTRDEPAIIPTITRFSFCYVHGIYALKGTFSPQTKCSLIHYHEDKTFLYLSIRTT